MKIYRDRVLIDEVPNYRRKSEGKNSSWEFFPRLVGVNVSSDGNAGNGSSDTNFHLYVEPIYIPLVRIDRGREAVVLWLNNLERPLWMITLSRRWPFVQIFKYDWMILEE